MILFCQKGTKRDRERSLDGTNDEDTFTQGGRERELWKRDDDDNDTLLLEKRERERKIMKV